MHERQKTNKARLIGYGIGIVLVVAVVVAKLVLKFEGSDVLNGVACLWYMPSRQPLSD